MVKIRALTPKDIDYVTDSVNREKWGHTRSDVKRCFDLEPNGCFIAEIDRKPVGHAFSICYGKLGWIGLLIVEKEHREKGIGTELMKASINYLQRKHAETIKLEAVPEAVSLYKRLGFKEEFDSLRLSLNLKTTQANVKTKTNIVKSMKEADIEKVSAFDSDYFGANRSQILKALFREYPQYCFIAEKAGEVLGYIMARQTTYAYLIAPWVCSPRRKDVATALFLACKNALGTDKTEIRLGAPAINKSATTLLDSLGFQQISKSIRMIYGREGVPENIKGVFGIGGPEKG